jgi:hypothetical protein
MRKLNEALSKQREQGRGLKEHTPCDCGYPITFLLFRETPVVTPAIQPEVSLGTASVADPGKFHELALRSPVVVSIHIAAQGWARFNAERL